MVGQSEQVILVTGASGYIGGHIVKQALEKGYSVRAAVRSESSAAKLQSLFPEHAALLTAAIVPDITKAESYEQALKGVTGIIHAASPFTLTPEDNIRDVLTPAINGALAILEAAQRYGPAVRRIVHVSSFTAIHDLRTGYRPGHKYSDADWNEVTYEDAVTSDPVGAYAASKPLAEKAMWDWMAKNQPAFSLTSINPPWVFGPHVGGLESTKNMNVSSGAIYQLLDAEKVPATDFAAFVDVRDVAEALVLAVEAPEAAGQRFFIGAHFDYQSAADAIRSELPELKSRVPEGTPGAGKVENVYEVDGSRASKLLGLKYTSLEQSMKDSYLEFLQAENRTVSVGA